MYIPSFTINCWATAALLVVPATKGDMTTWLRGPFETSFVFSAAFWRAPNTARRPCTLLDSFQG